MEFLITKSPEGRRKEGKIVRVVSHGTTKVIGLYEKSKSFGFVRPDNQRFLKDIYIPAGKEKRCDDRTQGSGRTDVLRRGKYEAGGKSRGDHRAYQ